MATYLQFLTYHLIFYECNILVKVIETRFSECNYKYISVDKIQTCFFFSMMVT